MLERLFARFDALCAKYGLFKAETIGDAFLAVAGIPNYINDHVARVRTQQTGGGMSLLHSSLIPSIAAGLCSTCLFQLLLPHRLPSRTQVAAFALEAIEAAHATLIDTEDADLGTVQIRVRCIITLSGISFAAILQQSQAALHAT